MENDRSIDVGLFCFLEAPVPLFLTVLFPLSIALQLFSSPQPVTADFFFLARPPSISQKTPRFRDL